MEKKIDTALFMFGAIISAVICMMFSGCEIIHGIIIGSVNVSATQILRGILIIILSASVATYGGKQITLILLPVTFVIGICYLGFYGWQRALFHFLSTLAWMAFASILYFTEGNTAEVVGKTVFATIMAMIFEAFMMSLITAVQFGQSVIPAIIVGFVAGILAGIIIIVTKAINSRSAKGRHEYVAVEEEDDELLPINRN